MDEVDLFVRSMEEEHRRRMEALRERVQSAVVRALSRERARAEAETADLEKRIREEWRRRRRALEGRYVLLYHRELSARKASLLASARDRLEAEVKRRVLAGREGFLRALVRELSHLASEGSVLQVPPEDVRAARSLVAEMGLPVEVEGAPDLSLGVRLVLPGGKVVAENTLEGRMERARVELALACGRVFGKAVRG